MSTVRFGKCNEVALVIISIDVNSKNLIFDDKLLVKISQHRFFHARQLFTHMLLPVVHFLHNDMYGCFCS
jgi:hypothetical protein